MQQDKNYTDTTLQTVDEIGEIEIPAVRPWVRFFARDIDYFVFAFFFGLLWGKMPIYFSPNTNIMVASLLCLFIWVFIEPVLLSTWGTTPGKWLLKTQLRDSEGKKLTFRQALKRSVSVWFKGLGMGIPLVVLITLLVGRHTLVKNKITTWDKAQNLSVTHKEIGITRVAIGILILILGDTAFLYYTTYAHIMMPSP